MAVQQFLFSGGLFKRLSLSHQTHYPKHAFLAYAMLTGETVYYFYSRKRGALYAVEDLDKLRAVVENLERFHIPVVDLEKIRNKLFIYLACHGLSIADIWPIWYIRSGVQKFLFNHNDDDIECHFGAATVVTFLVSKEYLELASRTVKRWTRLQSAFTDGSYRERVIIRSQSTGASASHMSPLPASSVEQQKSRESSPANQNQCTTSTSL